MWIDRIADFCIERRRLVVTFIGLVTVVFASFAVRIPIKTVFEDLLPSKHPYVQVHEQFKEKFGGSNIVTIMVTAKQGDIFQLPVLEKVRNITLGLTQIPAVNQFQIVSLATKKLKEVRSSTEGIESKPLMWPDLPRSQAEVDDLREKVLRNNLVYGLYVSSDLRSTLITVDFFDRSVDYGVVFSSVQALVGKYRDATVDISLAGDPILFGWVNYYFPETLALIGLTLLVVGVLLFALNRTWRGTLYPYIAGLISAVWSLGICDMIGIHFDPLVAVVAMLITARAVSHSVQIVTRFQEEVEALAAARGDPDPGADISRIAAKTTLAELFRPGILGILVDAACVLVVALSPIPILQKLALMAMIWLLTIGMSACILTPVLLSWTPRPLRYALAFDLETLLLRPFLRLCWQVTVTRWRNAVMVGTAIVFVVSFYFSLHIKIGDANPGSPILQPQAVYNQDSAYINRQFPGADRMFVVIQGKERDTVKKNDVLVSMTQFQRFMESQPEIGGTVSLADALPAINSILREGNPRYLELGDTQEVNGELLYLLDSVSDPGDLDRYVDKFAQNGAVTLFFRDRKGETIRTAVARVNEFVDTHPLPDAQYKLAGGLIGVLAAANEVILKHQIEAIAFSLLILVLMCTWTYRSTVAGMFFMVPVIISNTVTFSVMAWQDIGMNINTVPVAALGIGLGVDYALYICDRIRHELIHHPVHDPDRAVQVAINSAGRGVLVTAIVLIISILVWSFSSLRFQAEMGFLIAIWLGVSAFSALFVMPALAYFFKPKFIYDVSKERAHVNRREASLKAVT